LAEQGHELPRKILDWRQVAKLRSTYTEALPNHVNPTTHRVHTCYALASTTTGRLSSSEPNLQNIPIRTEEGRKIRRAFIAAEGHQLVSADYSQIELRLLAEIAQIEQLRKAFRDNLDIHAMTASEMFGVPVKGMPSDVRRRAKAINFGIIYGISAFGLANQLGIEREEAGAYIRKYFERFPGIRDYMEASKAFAKQNGYVLTLFGRKCHYPDLANPNPSVRAFNERAAINARLQGTAADIIRHAMVRMDAALQKEKLSARMLLQVHDELVFEVPDDQVEKTLPVVKKVMEEAPMPALSLSVPLRVDARAANNWDERIAPVAAGRVAARGREMALRVRARQHVMRVDGIAAARDWLALLGQRRLLGDIVGVGVKVLDALGYHHTLCVLPRTFADAVARTHSRFAARLCRAEISPPIGVGRACGPGERLAMRVGALDTAEVGAIALTHAGYEER
jgi:hypothetical protein